MNRQGGGAAPGPVPTSTDRALLMACAAWGGHALPSNPLWRRFSPDWRTRLEAASADADPRVSPEAAWQALLADHRASSRPDLARVHPSWVVRVLMAEPTGVRRIVADVVAEPARSAIRRAFGLGDAPSTIPPASPLAVEWVGGLWAERLVGDVSARDDDPAVIVAMTRLSPRERFRLVRVIGLVKHAFAIEGHGPTADDEARARFTVADRVRLGFFRRMIGRADPRLAAIARSDLGVIGEDHRRGIARLGLVSVARLLATVEPHRARWAVQHVPYPVAKLIRSASLPPTRDQAGPKLPARVVAAWEDWIIEAAWARFLSEGRSAAPADPDVRPSPLGGFQ